MLKLKLFYARKSYGAQFEVALAASEIQMQYARCEDLKFAV